MLKKVRLMLLFDFYGKLLTERQQEILDYYLKSDYSYSEIGELVGSSRQAVYDNVKRSEKLLEHYETELALFSKFQTAQEAIDGWMEKMDALAERTKGLTDEEIKSALRTLKTEGVRLIEW